jgi:hypothetical protein
MTLFLVMTLGLVLEAVVIVALGRQATAKYEAEASGASSVPAGGEGRRR